ncbi:MAG TPA: DNA translocase FtsK 4TM domain-containing protein, partial [Gemmatimonadaceae bacterium]
MDLTASDSSYSRSSALKRELTGIILILFALFLSGALAMQGVAMLRGGDITRTFGWAGSLLAYPLARFFGWPAAALIPIALFAHALRLFGRLAERTDRSWLVFLLGLVVLLPVGLGLGEGGLREATNLSGLWGSFAAYYLLQFAGTAGAWIIVVLSLSALMAATLSWNP